MWVPHGSVAGGDAKLRPLEFVAGECLDTLLQLAQQMKGPCDPESLTREVQ
jgi:hypothetical protein